MRTIIHVTDYSDNALAALKYARLISTELKANLLVLHVFDIPTTMGTKLKEPYYHLEEDTFKMHRTKLKKLCAEHLGSNFDKMNVRVEAIEDKSVVNGIISKAVEMDAYMIIAGTKGGSKFKELIMGNTTKHLLEKSPCPVLSIPVGMSHRKINTIVYATDFEEEDIIAIIKLCEIAESLNAQMQVVHISTKKEYAGEVQMEWFKEMLKEKVNYKEISFEVLFNEDVFDALKVYLIDVGADIVAMLERKKEGVLQKISHRDLVKKMESYGGIPLISFNKYNYELLDF